MNPEERALLERSVSLSEENNQILHGMRRAARWGLVSKIVYWGVIIGISYGAYVYIQPYVDRLTKAYDDLKGVTDTVQRAGSQVNGLEGFLNSLPK